MEKEVLKRYFERTSTETETKAVEDWLLDPNNKIAFENFLEEEWGEYVQTNEVLNIVQMRKSKNRMGWKAVSVAAILFLIFGVYQLFVVDHTQSDLAENGQVANVQQEELPLTSPPTAPEPQLVSDTVNDFQPKTVQHAKKKSLSQSKAIVAMADTVNQEINPKSVTASKLGHFKVNEVQLAKLVQKIDSNKFVFDVNIADASFHRLAELLHKEYGIVLELCSATETKKTYSARFEKISIHDLLDDMSEKMMFSYTFQGDKVKICF